MGYKSLHGRKSVPSYRPMRSTVSLMRLVSSAWVEWDHKGLGAK